MLLLNNGLSQEEEEESIVEFNKVEDLNKLNEIISELVDLTQDDLTTTTNDERQLFCNSSQAELRREQSQINWFLSHNDDTVVNENFDFDLFDNVLISNNDPMIGEIKLF
jgi:hypothetical protein